MNTPNPLIPQGALPNIRGRSHIRIAVFTILAVHVVLLGALLMAGCKKTSEQGKNETVDSGYQPPPFDPNTLPVTNTAAVAPTTAPPSVITSPVPPSPLPPPIAVPPPSPTLTEGTEHTVIKGDSFFTLAKKYNVSSRAIAAANPGVDSSRLKIGQKLKIPPGTSSSPAAPAGNGGNALIGGSDRVYTVKSGDTLSRIARENGVSLK